MRLTEIPILSFFTGAGFMDMGFHESNFKVVWTNESDEMFAKLYSEGMTSWKGQFGEKGVTQISNKKSIKDLTKNEILKEAFGKSIPSIFGIIGGPPCQDFSINGNLNGFQGERGSLTDTYISKILDLKPAFFVMENVTGLIKVKKSAKHFAELLKTMEKSYLIDHAVLNSINFGVPQSRERIFVIGINRSVFKTEKIKCKLDGSWFPFTAKEKYARAIDLFAWPDAVAFGSTPNKPANIPMELCLMSCLVSEKDESLIANANEYFLLHGDKRQLRGIKEGETNRPSFKRLHRYKYSPTACYGNNEVHLHPFLHRRLSVREAMRVQGVSESYRFETKGYLSKKFKMIGNGVPVPLARGVAATLFELLEGLEVK